MTLTWSAVSGASCKVRWDKKGTIGWSNSRTVSGTSITISGMIPDTAYAFDICAVIGGVGSSYASTVYGSTRSLNVSNLTGTSPSTGTIKLSWTAIPGASGYKIRYDLKNTWGWSWEKDAAGSTLTITGLKSGKTYAFQIYGYYGSYEGSWSDTVYVTVK